jgi:hypothetical protein
MWVSSKKNTQKKQNIQKSCVFFDPKSEIMHTQLNYGTRYNSRERAIRIRIMLLRTSPSVGEVLVPSLKFAEIT